MYVVSNLGTHLYTRHVAVISESAFLEFARKVAMPILLSDIYGSPLYIMSNW